MTFYLGDHDAAAIVMDHCRSTGQKFTLHTTEDPRGRPDGEYIVFRDLNWNHIGHLEGGDRVFFESHGVVWEIYVHSMPRPVDRSGLECVKKLEEMQRRVRG